MPDRAEMLARAIWEATMEVTRHDYKELDFNKMSERAYDQAVAAAEIVLERLDAGEFDDPDPQRLGNLYVINPQTVAAPKKQPNVECQFCGFTTLTASVR